ncbi:MAG: pentapeptide repeat-containing protein [Acidimicrobiales bacterium]
MLAAGTYGPQADFSSALLTNVDFRAADLMSTRWRYSEISNVDFSAADLTGADFAVATLSGNVWSNTFCPSGVNSDDNGGNCNGQFTHGAPAVEG